MQRNHAIAADNGADPSWKEQKRQLKLQRKRDKLVRKRARREEKLASKLGRRQQREVIAYRARIDRDSATNLIEELLAGLKAGKVTVEHDERQLTVEPPEVVDIRVRARQTWKSQGLTIRVRWPRSEVTEGSAALKVGAN